MAQASAMKQRSDSEFPTCAGGEDRGHPAADGFKVRDQSNTTGL
jgi:hypothetical protein